MSLRKAYLLLQFAYGGNSSCFEMELLGGGHDSGSDGQACLMEARFLCGRTGTCFHVCIEFTDCFRSPTGYGVVKVAARLRCCGV